MHTIIKLKWVGLFLTIGLLHSCKEDTVICFAHNEPEEHIVHFKSNIIKDKYIVVFNESQSGLPISRRAGNPEEYRALVRDLSDEILKSYAIEKHPEHIYSHVITGFSIEMSALQKQALQKDSRVLLIEEDQEISLGIMNNRKRPGDGGSTEEPPAVSSQVIPPGIKRVKGGSTPYTGSHIVFILDTGIELDHPDLNVSTNKAFTAFTKGKDANFTDYNGHGTHVAGTVGAINNTIGVVGVAPGVALVPIKVLDSRGSGTMSGVIAGVDHVARVASSGDVANMSLGGGVSTLLDDAVQKLASTGVKVVIAAGNSGTNAINTSPARVNHPNAYTISAMNSSDVFASFSNYGNPPIRYCAPGVNIYSTWIGKSYNTISGTSMAAPHVAGILLFSSQTDGVVKGDPDGIPDPILVVQ
jgi:subtilisin family serine protease